MSISAFISKCQRKKWKLESRKEELFKKLILFIPLLGLWLKGLQFNSTALEGYTSSSSPFLYCCECLSVYRELPLLLPPTIPLTEKHHHHQYTLTLLVGSTRSMTSFFSSFKVCSCRLRIGPFTAPTPPILCFIYCSSRASQHCHEHQRMQILRTEEHHFGSSLSATVIIKVQRVSWYS